MSDLHQRYTRFRPVSDFGPAHMTPAADGGYVNYGDLREALAVQEAIHADAELVLYADHVAALAEAERVSSKVIADFQRQAREAALREALGDLSARIDREAAERDGDGLLDGLRYAHDCVQRLIDGGSE